jgi:precorrin-6A/cobalt-precorrin-6A reductase
MMDSQRGRRQGATSLTPMPFRVLILGGTTEASALADAVAGDPRLTPILSLAGRTNRPRAQPIATRSGGFGGIAGLLDFLRRERIEAVVDATHPYADQISSHAVRACGDAAVPLASLVRPEWSRLEGDRWQIVADTTAAALALGPVPRRVFLSLGRQDLHLFAVAPHHHYLARMIEPPAPEDLPPVVRILQERGPFERPGEEQLLRDEGIDVLVSRNSGGLATYAKIEAARALALPVLMIKRPPKPSGEIMASVEGCVAWLHGLSPRGV